MVFDTNVLVSAYAFGGKPAELIRAVIRGEMALITSAEILAELARVLADKLDFDDEHIRAVVLQVARIGTVVQPERRLSVVDDEADNRILECAVEGSADAIASGDRHLLAIGSYERIRILTPAQLLRTMG